MKKVVFLTDAERAAILDLARRRCGAKAPHIRTQTSGWNPGNARDRAYPHAVGLAAEWAYALATGASVDERLLPGGDEGDFADGLLEIKCTSHRKPPFVLAVKQSEYERKRPLAYVLARVDPELLAVEFLGSISRARFDDEKRPQMGKHALNWVVPAWKLSPGFAVVEGLTLKLNQFTEAVV